ncbi:hypothetical protein ACNA6I_17465 [Rossellomorea sp. FS2]
MENNIKSDIELFILEAKRLTSKSLYKFFQENEVVFSDGSVEENVPDIEQLEAYVLHLRKFLQANERVFVPRIRKICNKILYDNEIDSTKLNQFYDVYQQMFKSKSILKINNLTLEDILNARLYGDLSHLNEENRILYSSLIEDSNKKAIYNLEFTTLLVEAGEIILEMAIVCGEDIIPCL